MNKNRRKKLFGITLVHTAFIYTMLYHEKPPYYLWAIVLGILVGLLFFVLIPKPILNEWFYSKQVKKIHLRFIFLVGPLLSTWPLILAFCTGIDVIDSNVLLLNIAYNSICFTELFVSFINNEN